MPTRPTLAQRLLPLVGLLLAGCSLLPQAGPVPYPEGCGSFGFSARRCAAVVARARESVAEEPTLIELLQPEPNQIKLGGYQLLRVVFTLADGTQQVTPVTCIGIPDGPGDWVCQEPRLDLETHVDHDVPCDGPEPDDCPRQIVPDPAAVAAAHPLHVPRLDIPVDTVGHREIKVGDVTLPNGYVTRVGAQVLNDQPDDFWIADTMWLDLRPVDPARPPFANVYQRPLVDGVEEAELWLTFDVTEASPGAVLHLADIVAE